MKGPVEELPHTLRGDFAGSPLEDGGWGGCVKLPFYEQLKERKTFVRLLAF